jgi:hypothetical protein
MVEEKTAHQKASMPWQYTQLEQGEEKIMKAFMNGGYGFLMGIRKSCARSSHGAFPVRFGMERRMW